MDDAEFFSWYGHWAPLRPTEVLDLLGGGGFPYWIAGGWAIDAFTGRSREHADIDVTVLARDFAAVRDRLHGYHIWEAQGSLRPLLPGAAMPDEDGQVWVRRDAASPWLVDLLLTPADGDDWVCKRDRSIRLPLDVIGWTSADGAPYLKPEIVLLMKAKHDQPKDRADFDAALPLLDPAARDWLVTGLRSVHPGHPWLAALGEEPVGGPP